MHALEQEQEQEVRHVAHTTQCTLTSDDGPRVLAAALLRAQLAVHSAAGMAGSQLRHAYLMTIRFRDPIEKRQKRALPRASKASRI